jgi:hypothetical protein
MMSPTDVLGQAIAGLLLAGFVWALIDLLVKIHRQPKRKFDFLRLTSYPFVPDDEILEEMLKKEQEESSGGFRGGLPLKPLTVKVKHRDLP